ncbi:hypothetical protein A2197_01255 [Candidatus Woesebacteria bacterium RIFOXYA1_FULL_48_16]|uniref:Radical SAM core domain-containing protein n=1 Tax=Candidatus Woesebacteria bacterium RIFOXYA1_FULL_48_16 TaxID=1802535 RepID=A0A1F8CVN7_9BACT|nr:MAG: hypothetical protein A2197_01255 [Candidatus Woesebacteria bacterium RIFOXYA1_FULL_48_16]
MRLPIEMSCIQIIVNNVCEHDCCHCSQLIGHQSNKYQMTLDYFERALVSLQGHGAHIGLFGGNPLLHPQFPELCELLRKYQPVKARRELWCSGARYDKYKAIIDETFYPELVAYNAHEDEQDCWHQPVLIAPDEVFEDKALMWRVIENCWVNKRWSAAVTPLGAFFCEIASAIAWLLKESIGEPVIKDWWKQGKGFWRRQRETICPLCSACLPMPMVANDKQNYDDISAGNLDRIVGSSPKCKRGAYRIINTDNLRDYYKGHTFEPETDFEKRGWFKDFPFWAPNRYREVVKHAPETETK